MNRLLLLLLAIFSFTICQSQTGYLFVKKGSKKKRTYLEYDRIMLRLHDGTMRYGMITRLMNDTIYISGNPIPRTAVAAVVLNDKKKKTFQLPAKDLLLITAGAALTTAGLTLSKQATFKEAAIAGAVIGYGPLVLGYAKSKLSLKRKKFTIGKKFRLQVLDFYLPRKRAF
jgi:hypothetical protein